MLLEPLKGREVPSVLLKMSLVSSGTFPVSQNYFHNITMTLYDTVTGCGCCQFLDENDYILLWGGA
jgi:hypothetical protein